MQTSDRSRPRTAIVEDSTIIREALPLMFPELDVRVAVSSMEALTAALPMGLDLIVLDLKLRNEDSVPMSQQGIVAIRALLPLGVPICLYTDERRRLVLAQCLRAGAQGVVHKSESTQTTLEAFLAVADGEAIITPSLIGLAELVERKGGLPELTDRQREVLAARARGEA